MADADKDWIRETIDRAVQDISKLDIIPDELIEARPIWSVKGKVMIGQMRQAGEPAMFIWFISGDLPTDHIGGNAAGDAREALRHFSLKWQLDAERYADPETRRAHGLDPSLDWRKMTEKLIAKAEELYAMSANDRLWRDLESS